MYGISGVKIKWFHAPNQAVWTKKVILASETLTREREREEGRAKERERGKRGKGERTAIPVSFSIALEGIDKNCFYHIPGKDITKNFRIHFLRMVCN